jgi:hypothetical protein
MSAISQEKPDNKDKKNQTTKTRQSLSGPGLAADDVKGGFLTDYGVR